MDENILNYKIGDDVLISKVSDTIFSEENHSKEIITTDLRNILHGKIVGIKKKCIGDLERSIQSSFSSFSSLLDPPEQKPNYLTNIRTIYFLEVKVGMLNKPLFSLPENLKKIDKKKDIPLLVKNIY